MEILDPAQNCAFRDNYLDLPFDLSRVFFITTANSVETVPRPLQDRMEILRLSGYSDEEKLEEGEKIILTGHMGEVMKESAMAAQGYIVSHCESLGLAHPGKNLHIHVPVGAIPKDGPSAGITMAVALASLYAGRPARGDTALTGEITLSGLVLSVGGVKEKVLAARRAGIRRIVLPRENEHDLRQLPEPVAQEMEFLFVESVGEALPLAIPGFPGG